MDGSDHAFESAFQRGIERAPDYSVSQWADAHIMLSAESSAEPGRWRTDRAPYQREIMDCITDPSIKTMVIKSSAQVGKTSILLAGMGYHIHHAPAPMLAIQPTLNMAEAFSKDKLSPMVRDTPALAELVADERSRNAANTIYHKQFPGGQLTLAGANSPTSLRMRSVKIVWADEIDAYPPSAGDEGDPLKLAVKRTQTFFDSKLVCSSTPTIKGLSRVDDLFEGSDKRFFFVPCAHCDHHQVLEWERVVWTKGQPAGAHYSCETCGTLWDDAEIKRQVKLGEWRATEPFAGTAGFHIWQIYSPWSTLEQICSEFEESEGKSAERQVWWNTTLGEVWDGDETAGVSADELYQRRENYNTHEVPEHACVVTAGVDVQADRLEILIKAYGAGNESWCLQYLKIYGDPSGDAVWSDLREMLMIRLAHPSGRTMGIDAAAIDSGYLTDRVYEFCGKNFGPGKTWYAVKGVGGEGKVGWVQSKSRNKWKAHLFNVGVDTFKTTIYSQLGNRETGSDYIHFPNVDQFDEGFFEQLTVERVRTVYDTRGFARREWYKPAGRRNEAIDLNAYADAAHRSTNTNHSEKLRRLYGHQGTANAADVAKLFM